MENMHIGSRGSRRLNEGEQRRRHELQLLKSLVRSRHSLGMPYTRPESTTYVSVEQATSKTDPAIHVVVVGVQSFIRFQLSVPRYTERINIILLQWQAVATE